MQYSDFQKLEKLEKKTRQREVDEQSLKSFNKPFKSVKKNLLEKKSERKCDKTHY